MTRGLPRSNALGIADLEPVAMMACVEIDELLAMLASRRAGFASLQNNRARESPERRASCASMATPPESF